MQNVSILLNNAQISLERFLRSVSGTGRHRTTPVGTERHMPTSTGLDRHKTGTDQPGAGF
jgi:hypothetical protein